MSGRTGRPLDLRQMILEKIRGVAQPGSALGSGPRSREFKSPLPDQFIANVFKQSHKNQVAPQS